MFYHFFLIFLVTVQMSSTCLLAHENANADSFSQVEDAAAIQHPSLVDAFAEHVDLNLHDLSLLDWSEFYFLPFWNHSTPSLVDKTSTLSEKQRKENIALTEHPKWGQGDVERTYEYYALHQEKRLDSFLGFIACRLGVIIHGDVNQEKLALDLKKVDLQRILQKGPYPNPILSLAAQQLIYESLHTMPRVLDIHLHNLGYDEGNYLNPRAAACGVARWKDYFTFLVLRYASGMSSPFGSTHEARKRIQLYADSFPKLNGFILPIHKAILPNGTVDWNTTGNFLKNRSALLTATSFHSADSELFPAVSVHPFDPKWQEKLMKAHAKGIRLVKWMPPQSIPPDSDLLDTYYQTLKQLDMVLIAHAGPEHAIPTHKDNEQWIDWGNPLRFRKPLELGVNVILAHCGHKDNMPDLDDPQQPEVPGYQLFLRLAREAHQKNQTGEWTGKLYGDLAAVTTHYGADFIQELLFYANEEGIRLIYGSDYPYTNLVKPRNDAYDICAKADLLDPKKVQPLKEIRAWNPLLANYIFTKNLELQLPNGQKITFSEATFTGAFKDAELKLIDQEMWQAYQEGLQKAPE